MFDVPVTLALNCCVVPAATDTLSGATLTVTLGTIATFAEADLVGSAELVTTTVTLAGEGAMGGAEYTADNELVASVPQVEPLQPAPLKPQVTAVFEVPVTLALKSCMPEVEREALVGLMLNKTAAAVTTATFAEADLVGSATLVAFTLTAAGDGTLAGATNSPLAEIVPHATPVHPAPLSVQVTAVFEDPVTFPTNC